jgi:TPR repeat protein
VALQEGEDVSKNDVEAAKYFKLSAEHGFDLAEYTLGLALAGGQGAAKNLLAAMRYFKRASDQGYDRAIAIIRDPSILEL